MRYLFLLWGDEAAELALTGDERGAIVAAHGEFVRRIRAEGREATGEPLGPSGEAIVVGGRRPSATDGPFLETKEQLGGFYVIDCAGSRRCDRRRGPDSRQPGARGRDPGDPRLILGVPPGGRREGCWGDPG